MSVETPPPDEANDAEGAEMALAALKAARAEFDLATITVPAPTPDEDGVYRPQPYMEVGISWSRRHVFLRHTTFLDPDDAEALGAALIAVARDARRGAANG